MEFFLNNPALATYLFLKIDAVNGFLLACSLLAALGALSWGIYHLDNSGSYEREYHPDIFEKATKIAPDKSKTFFVVAVILMGLFFVAPSKKDVAIMIGVSAGVSAYKHVSDSPVTQKAFDALMGYAEKELDEMLVKQQKKEEKK